MGIENKNPKEVAEIFRQIADKVESGSLTLQNQAGQSTIEFPEQMKFTMKLEDEQGRKLERSYKMKLKLYVGEKPAGQTKIL